MSDSTLTEPMMVTYRNKKTGAVDVVEKGSRRERKFVASGVWVMIGGGGEAAKAAKSPIGPPDKPGDKKPPGGK